MKKHITPEDDGMYVYRAFITLKNGRRLYARDYGKKAWRIPVR